MRIAHISLISFFACWSATANVNLPIVNIGAGSVSARAAFGQDLDAMYGAEPVSVIAEEKPVVRVAKIEKLIPNSNDVLLPNKPRDDLWASNDTGSVHKMNIPVSNVFASLGDDNDLSEETLQNSEDFASTESSSLDSQIEKLVELQKRASKSVSAPTTISSYDLKPTENLFAEKSIEELPIIKSKSQEFDDDKSVAINRVVVPAASDVIVRSVKPAMKNTNKFKSDSDFAKLSPTELKKAFKKTYLSENKHLSTYQIDDRFDEESDVSTKVEGFSAEQDLSESGGVRPLEIKIGFRGDDSSLSRDNYNLLTEYAGIVVSNPKRAIQVSIPQDATLSLDGRKLTARRLAIVEQVLRDTGISDTRIMPVLTQRSDDNFVLRVISSDQYETLSQQKRDMFGDSVGKKTYKSLSW